MPGQATSKVRLRSAGRWFQWAVMFIVVVTAGAVAYWWRPLNSTERMLVGGWEPVTSYKKSRFDLGNDAVWFGENRRFAVTRPQVRRLPTGVEVTTQNVIQQGRWEASSTSLGETFDVPGTSPWGAYRQRPILLFYRLIGRTRTRYPLRFEGPDRVWVNDVEFQRVEAPIKE
jgi:hypothetical protein